MPNDLNLEDNDASDPQDAVRKVIRLSKLLARAVIRLEHLEGAVPPGPPHEPPFKEALVSLQESGGRIKDIAERILQRPGQ